MNVPNIADNPYVSLADLRDQNNGEEFLEKCVKNWNAWVEMTQNLNEVEERNNTLIVEQSNLAKQLDTSLRVNKDLQQQILVRIQICYFSLPLQIIIFLRSGGKNFVKMTMIFKKIKRHQILYFLSQNSYPSRAKKPYVTTCVYCTQV